MLRLSRIDNAHQFVLLGQTFRPELDLLKEKLFKKFRVEHDAFLPIPSQFPVILKAPLLTMSAAFSN